MEYEKFYKFLEGRPLAELTKCQESVDEIVIKRTIETSQEAMIEAFNKDRCDSDILDEEKKNRLDKVMENIIQTGLLLPHGMNGFNRDSKRFIRWLPGYNRPARPSIVAEQNIPLDWFIHRELQLYIHWCAEGYFEMSCKDSLKFNQTYPANQHLLAPPSPADTLTSSKGDTSAKRKLISFSLGDKSKKQKAAANAIAKDWSYFSESEGEEAPEEKLAAKSEDSMHADTASETLSESSKPPFLLHVHFKDEIPATSEPVLGHSIQQPPADSIAPSATCDPATTSAAATATNKVSPPLVLLPPPPVSATVPAAVSTSTDHSPRRQTALPVGTTVRVLQGTHKGKEGMVLGAHWSGPTALRVQFHGEVVVFPVEHLQVVTTPAPALDLSPVANSTAPPAPPAPHVIPEMSFEPQQEPSAEAATANRTTKEVSEFTSTMPVLVDKWTAETASRALGGAQTQIVHIGQERPQSSAVLQKLRSTSIISTASGDSVTDNGSVAAPAPTAGPLPAPSAPYMTPPPYREMRTPVTYNTDFGPRPMPPTINYGNGNGIHTAYPTAPPLSVQQQQQQPWLQPPQQPPPPYQPPPPSYVLQAPYGQYGAPTGAYIPVQARPMYPPVTSYPSAQHYYNAPLYPAPPPALQLSIPPPRYTGPPMQPAPMPPGNALEPTKSDTSNTINHTCWVRVKKGKYVHEEGEFVSQSPVDTTLARVRFYEHAGSKSRQVEIKVCDLAVFSLNNRAKEIPLDSYLAVLKMGMPGPKLPSKTETEPNRSELMPPGSQRLGATEFRSESAPPNGAKETFWGKDESARPEQQLRRASDPVTHASADTYSSSNHRSSPVGPRESESTERYLGLSRKGERDLESDRGRHTDRHSDERSDRAGEQDRTRSDRSSSRSNNSVHSRSPEQRRESERPRDQGSRRPRGRSSDRDSSGEDRRHRPEERARKRELEKEWEQVDRERREEMMRERSKERNRGRDEGRDGDRDRDRDRDWSRGDANAREPEREKHEETARGRDKGRDNDNHDDRKRSTGRAPVREYASGRVSVSDIASGINAEMSPQRQYSPPSRSYSADSTTATTSSTRSGTTTTTPSAIGVTSSNNGTPTTNGFLRNVMHAINVPERVRAVGMAERPRDPFSRQTSLDQGVLPAPLLIPTVPVSSVQLGAVPSVPHEPARSESSHSSTSLGRGDLVEVTRGTHAGLIAVIVEPPESTDPAQEYLVMLNDGRNSAARLASGDFVATG